MEALVMYCVAGILLNLILVGVGVLSVGGLAKLKFGDLTGLIVILTLVPFAFAATAVAVIWDIYGGSRAARK